MALITSVMASQGSFAPQDVGKSTIHEISAVFWLLGTFLAAMSPLLLLPLFLRDSQGRKLVGGRTILCIFGVGFTTILGVLATINWHVVAPFAEKFLVGMQSVFNVAKELPGDLVEWLESGEGFYLLVKAFVAFAVVALFSSRVLPILHKSLGSLNARMKGIDVSLEPRPVNREEIAASRERQQQDLQGKIREKDELLRQRRLARAAEDQQRSQRFGAGFGTGVGQYAR